MTYYYNIRDNSNIDIYEANQEYTGKITTVNNDGSGIKLPDKVLSVMSETFMEVVELGDNPTIPRRAGYIVVDLTTNNIKEGIPPSLQE